MLLESFTVYTLFAFILYECAKVAQKNNPQTRLKRGINSFPKEYVLCVFFFFLVAGLRYDVGVDYLSYLDDYVRALNGNFWERDRGYEESYKYLTICFGSLGVHPILYFGFIASVQLFLVMYTYRKDRSIMPFIMLVIMLGDYFFSWMNGIRQSVAACIFVFSITFIKERKIFPYLICILLAYTWHRSSIMLIPFYLLAYDKHIWEKKGLLLLGIVICIILGNTPLWVSNITRFETLLSFIGYDFYVGRMDEYIDAESFTSFSLGPRLLCIIITYLLIVYFYPKARHRFPDSNIDLTFKLCYIGICGYFLFINTNLTFLRPVSYFTLFALPMTAYIIVYLKNSRYILIFYLVLITSMSSTYLSCLSDARVSKLERKSYLYHFYFEKDDISYKL